MIPRISIFIGLIEMQIWLKVERGETISLEELREVGKAMRFFAAETAIMENMLAARDSEPAGDNVVSLRDFAMRQAGQPVGERP